MKYSTPHLWRLLPVLFMLLLAGCGGGSSSSSDTSGDTTANTTPTANAGADQSVADGATVTLDASASSDSDGDVITWSWVQTAGPDVALSDASAEMPTFTAPTVAGGTTLTFELTVDDGEDGATDSVTITIADTTAATASVSPAGTLGIRNTIVITFSEVMASNSLSFDAGLGVISDGGTWNADNTVLTIAPDEKGAWESGVQSLALSINDVSGNTTEVNATFAINFVLDTFQNAAVVIGQTDFTGNAANRGATAAADTLYNPAGDPMVIDGRLWVVDTNNHRVLGYDGIPSTDGASAIWVIGQSSFTASSGGASDTMLLSPFDIAYDQSTFFVNDAGNSRVLAYDGVPLSPPGTASHVVGQADMSATVSGCSESYLKNPDAITIVAGKFILSDWANSRVLIWNSLPTGANNIPPDLVLGQSDFTHCTHRDDDQDGVAEVDPTARTLSYPSGVWSDGERLLVADTDNSRVLIWNNFPTSSFQPADLVIGHGDFVHDTERDDDQDGSADVYPTARTLADPTRVWSNGLQIIVTDQGNHRVLLWNDFPTENFQPADAVLGQADFAGKQANDDDQNNSEDASPTARTFKLPFGVGVYRNKLLVSDTNNHRMLVFKSK